MSYMKEVAQFLGVELEEEFLIKGGSKNVKYKFNNDYLVMVIPNVGWSKANNTLADLLNGKFKIVKLPKPILDDVERKYLATVIKPFRNRIKYFYKYPCGANGNYEAITAKIEAYGYCDCLDFPKFKKGSMYKNMKVGKEYSLEELGL